MEMLISNHVPVVKVETWQEFLISDRQYCICAAPLDEGLIAPDAGGSGVAIICQAQISGTGAEQE